MNTFQLNPNHPRKSFWEAYTFTYFIRKLQKQDIFQVEKSSMDTFQS